MRWERPEQLHPELILTTTGVQNALTLELGRRGWTVFPVPLPHSPWGVLENAVLVGDLLGLDATGLVEDLARRLLCLHGVGRGVRVYVEFDLGGPITIGRASYLADALRWMGMVNVYDREPRAYFAPALQEVPGLRPDIIVYEPKPWGAPAGAGSRIPRPRVSRDTCYSLLPLLPHSLHLRAPMVYPPERPHCAGCRRHRSASGPLDVMKS